MKKANRLFSILVMLSVVIGLGAAPGFTNEAVVRAQDVPPTPTVEATLPPPEPSQEPAEPSQLPAKLPPTAAPTTEAPTLAPLLQADSASVIPGAYIVVYKTGMDSRAIVRAGADKMSAMGGKVGHIYSAALHGFSAQLSAKALRALREDPRVDYIAPDETVSINDGIGAESVQTSPDWGLDRIDQRNLPLDSNYHYIYDGTGVNVYVIDTGILTTHTDFGGRASMVADEVEGSGDPNYMVDCAGHGTHVAGTIGGATYGVAKMVSLYGIKVLDCYGNGSVSGAIAGIDWVTAHYASPAVANTSLGMTTVSAPLDTAVNNSIASGVTYAVAAGNYDTSACTESPSRVPKAITVGATDSTDTRASFSNFGSCLDIFAPGVGITSDWIGSNTATHTLSGTSMATPPRGRCGRPLPAGPPERHAGQRGCRLDEQRDPGLCRGSSRLAEQAVVHTLNGGRASISLSGQ